MRSQTVRMQATEHPGDGEPDHEVFPTDQASCSELEELFGDRGPSWPLEALPRTTTDALAEEPHPGLLEMFLQAEFREVTRPSVRRTVVRVDL